MNAVYLSPREALVTGLWVAGLCVGLMLLSGCHKAPAHAAAPPASEAKAGPAAAEEDAADGALAQESQHDFDGRGGDLSRDQRRLTGRNGAIHQNDDETPLLLPHLVRHDVKGNRRRRRTRTRTARGKLDGREGPDGSWHSVLKDGEIRRVQAFHRLPLAVQDRDIELDQLDAPPKHGPVALCLCWRRRRWRVSRLPRLR